MECLPREMINNAIIECVFDNEDKIRYITKLCLFEVRSFETLRDMLAMESHLQFLKSSALKIHNQHK